MNPLDIKKFSERAKSECERVSHKELQAYFKMTIRKNRIPHYRKLYKKVCKKNRFTALLWGVFSEKYGDGYSFEEFKKGRIVKVGSKAELDEGENTRIFMSLIDRLASTVVGEKDFVIAGNPKLENFLNLIAYASSFFVSWSDYLIYYASGRKIIEDLFKKPSVTSLINIYVIIYAVQLTGAYDDTFFRENFIKLLPTLLPGDMLADIVPTTWIDSRQTQARLMVTLLPKITVYLEQKIIEGGYWEYTKMILTRVRSST